MATDSSRSLTAGAERQEPAKRYLWMHFARVGSSLDAEVPPIVRGEGCCLFDDHASCHLDGLSALDCANIGHGRPELDFYTTWSYAGSRSIELAARIAQPALGDLNRRFFTSAGSEAVQSAWKLARAYHTACGEVPRHRTITRYLACHGVSMAALTATGLPLAPSGPLTPGGRQVVNGSSRRWREDRYPLWAPAVRLSI